MVKGDEEKSTREGTVREPCQVRVGTEDTGEHGLGAELSIGRRLRVRPLLRFEAQLQTDSSTPLRSAQNDRGGRLCE